MTILASKEIENEALSKDADEIGADLIISDYFKGKNWLFLKIFSTLLKDNFHIIHSHGFFSAFHAHLVNRFFGLPHLLTVHGILENKFLGQGFVSLVKKKFLHNTLNNLELYELEEY